jgi:hypothetical protein
MRILTLICLCVSAMPVFSAELFKLRVSPIAMHPVEKNNFEEYRGSSPKFELTFVTPNQKTPLDAFPEPPFHIRNLITGFSCKGGDEGGIWKKSSVYVTDNGKVLILGSFSGSSNALEFYDIATCKQIYWSKDFAVKDLPIPQAKTNGKLIVFRRGLPASVQKKVASFQAD